MEATLVITNGTCIIARSQVSTMMIAFCSMSDSPSLSLSIDEHLEHFLKYKQEPSPLHLNEGLFAVKGLKFFSEFEEFLPVFGCKICSPPLRRVQIVCLVHVLLSLPFSFKS